MVERDRAQAVGAHLCGRWQVDVAPFRRRRTGQRRIALEGQRPARCQRRREPAAMKPCWPAACLAATSLATVLVCLLTAPAWGQKLPDLYHDETHGDPPYLSESGWRALVNGHDLGGGGPRKQRPAQGVSPRPR